MSFRLTYKEILELVANTVLYVPIARDIVRRAGIRPGGASGGNGPITALRLEYWNIYNHESGVLYDPPGAESRFERVIDNNPSAVPGLGLANTTMWLEGLTQVRVNARTIVPHPSAKLQVSWAEYGVDTGFERYWPDTGAVVFDLPFGTPNTAGSVSCGLTEEYNTSGWIDFLPEWLEREIYMQLETAYGDGESTAQLGMCELQLR